MVLEFFLCCSKNRPSFKEICKVTLAQTCHLGHRSNLRDSSLVVNYEDCYFIFYRYIYSLDILFINVQTLPCIKRERIWTRKNFAILWKTLSSFDILNSRQLFPFEYLKRHNSSQTILEYILAKMSVYVATIANYCCRFRPIKHENSMKIGRNISNDTLCIRE